VKRSRLALINAAFAFGSLASALATVEIYDIDPVHTWVGFSVSHFFTQVPGFFGKVKGTVTVDRKHLEKCKVEAIIEVASITTNTSMRDDDLRSANFFAADKFPAMTFKSKTWKHTSGDAYAVTGDLTTKSVTKSVVLNVTSQALVLTKHSNLNSQSRSTPHSRMSELGSSFRLVKKRMPHP